MLPALIPYYLWIKAFHVISIIAWMAGTFYLPRLFVYHTQTVIGSEGSERFKIMERRLLRGIMTPAMIATWVFGLLLVSIPGVVDFHQGWFHVKLTFVILMSAFHGICSKWRKELLADKRVRGEKFFRIANEIPTVLLIVIVIMAVVKPF